MVRATGSGHHSRAKPGVVNEGGSGKIRTGRGEQQLSHKFTNSFYLRLNRFGGFGQFIDLAVYLIDFNVGIPRCEKQRRTHAEQQQIHFFTGRPISHTSS
jgi:hypothetical protein